MNRCDFIKLIVIAILLIYMYYNSLKSNFNDSSITEIRLPIPKIIHQQGPKDRNKWHKDWIKCHNSWKQFFPEPEYTHILWDDESILDLIETNYPWLLPHYKGLPKDIMRYDIARLIFLYEYGGIYADLDFEVHKNFYEQLPVNKVSIAESYYKHESHQNALMASVVNHEFWMYMIKDIVSDIDKIKKTKHVLDAAGPRRLTKLIKKNKNMIHSLPLKHYNPQNQRVTPDVYTTHLHTGSWVDK